MRGSSEERAFTVEACFSIRQAVIATQRVFRIHFNVAREALFRTENQLSHGHYV